MATIVSDGQTTSLLGLARAIWRHRGAICATALVFMIATAIYVTQQKPLYTSEGALVVASRKIMIPGVEAISTPTGDIAIIRSEMGVAVAHAAERSRIDAASRHRSGIQSAAAAKERQSLGQTRPATVFAPLAQAKRRGADRSTRLCPAAVEAQLQKNLTLINNEKDYVIRLRFESEDPKTSAAVVNTLMDRYLTQYMQIKTTAAQQADTALNARADQLHRDADQADAAVAAFIKNNKLIATQSGSIVAQQLEDLNTQLASARADRAAAEARYRDALTFAQGGSPASNSEVLASPLIQALRTQAAELSRKQVELSTARARPSRPQDDSGAGRSAARDDPDGSRQGHDLAQRTG